MKNIAWAQACWVKSLTIETLRILHQEIYRESNLKISSEKFRSNKLNNKTMAAFKIIKNLRTVNHHKKITDYKPSQQIQITKTNFILTTLNLKKQTYPN